MKRCRTTRCYFTVEGGSNVAAARLLLLKCNAEIVFNSTPSVRVNERLSQLANERTTIHNYMGHISMFLVRKSILVKIV